MMDSIAALSMGMKQTQLQQAVQTSVLKKAMDGEAAQAQALIQDMLPATPAPSKGYLIDVYA